PRRGREPRGLRGRSGRHRGTTRKHCRLNGYVPPILGSAVATLRRRPYGRDLLSFGRSRLPLPADATDACRRTPVVLSRWITSFEGRHVLKFAFPKSLTGSNALHRRSSATTCCGSPRRDDALHSGPTRQMPTRLRVRSIVSVPRIPNYHV